MLGAFDRDWDEILQDAETRQNNKRKMRLLIEHSAIPVFAVLLNKPSEYGQVLKALRILNLLLSNK